MRARRNDKSHSYISSKNASIYFVNDIRTEIFISGKESMSMFQWEYFMKIFFRYVAKSISISVPQKWLIYSE